MRREESLRRIEQRISGLQTHQKQNQAIIFFQHLFHGTLWQIQVASFGHVSSFRAGYVNCNRQNTNYKANQEIFP